MTSSSILAGQIFNILRTVAEPIVGDLIRRYKLRTAYAGSDFPKDSKVVKKAVKDLEIVLGHLGLVTRDISDFLDELQHTGYYSRLAHDAFYGINDPGIRLQFEILFDRIVSRQNSDKQLKCSDFYHAIRKLLRESMRQQFRPDLLFLIDTHGLTTAQIDQGLDEKITQIGRQRSEFTYESARDVLLFDDKKRPISFFDSQHYPMWLRVDTVLVSTVVASINEGLRKTYGRIKLEGPSFQSAEVDVDDVYMPLRLVQEYAASAQLDAVAVNIGSLGRPLSLAILGDPGAGKSTILQKYCLDQARSALRASISR